MGSVWYIAQCALVRVRDTQTSRVMLRSSVGSMSLLTRHLHKVLQPDDCESLQPVPSPFCPLHDHERGEVPRVRRIRLCKRILKQPQGNSSTALHFDAESCVLDVRGSAPLTP